VRIHKVWVCVACGPQLHCVQDSAVSFANATCYEDDFEM